MFFGSKLRNLCLAVQREGELIDMVKQKGGTDGVFTLCPADLYCTGLYKAMGQHLDVISCQTLTAAERWNKSLSGSKNSKRARQLFYAVCGREKIQRAGLLLSITARATFYVFGSEHDF